MAVYNNIEALNATLVQLMEKDPLIVLYGQDAGHEGGVFRATQGIQAKFGVERVFDAPIAEAAIVGTAIGAAVAGLKPIVEIQFQVPIVVRMPMGGGIRALEHHSEAIEALYAHVPGLKVVMPSNPYDMKGLLVAAARDPDPVIFLENKKIYRAFKQEVPDELYEVPLGKANVLMVGSTITVVSYGAQIHDCLKAITNLKATNPDISVELIDLRSIKPIDTQTIVESVKKTGRLLVVHEAVKSFSTSAEIIARVNEKAFLYLQAPPMRLTG
ncbi:unnamed protein product [Didymodactylos carnosus]|uniref:Transketolase-like pyrimidine-binding domain-containing protein n=1 Tax=Didymodactylos carnosus TaxID=1234261 RepID=A0A8S2GCK2_9BILA|nr:unnamed protein product [Didymodactylos carnosus]CAF3491587.1 unnamed protein product [Didymodactylos carnosus]